MSVIPANPKILNSRPYTGNSDGAAAGPRAGMDEWIRQAIKYGAGAFWNNGSWGVRNMRGSESLSVHATGRAVDLSYRKSEQHPNARRKGSVAFLNILTANANALGLECVLDYIAPFGRGWRCDRQKWQKYTKETIHGVPGDCSRGCETNKSPKINPMTVSPKVTAIVQPTNTIIRACSNSISARSLAIGGFASVGCCALD